MKVRPREAADLPAVLAFLAVDDSRSRLRPEIPVEGAYGIPIRDELELEKRPC